MNCDIGDAQSVANANRMTLDSLGTPGVLVNNAGIAHVGNATNTSEEDFDQVMQINARGTFLCLRGSSPPHGESWQGRGAESCFDRLAPGYCRPLCLLRQEGRRSLQGDTECRKGFRGSGNSLQLRMSGTGPHTLCRWLLKKFYPDDAERNEKFEELSKYQPIGRMGDPDEIANLAAFLCSDEASFITGGGAYDIDGGVMSLR